ncbi:MAG: efflux RND transporter periplasmic adaptor subunit [Chthoniobacterales bacterium]|nr:efflux RND transporter periplasmic adaptor subunit [Chthoniobacterales bacterium]
MGALVFKTVTKVIKTDSAKARALGQPIPVQTVPARVQMLGEVIGGSGSVEQGNTVVLTGQLDAQVLEVPVKLGDVVKKGQVLARWDDRLIQAALQANRESVASNTSKIRDLTRQLSRYEALAKKKMGSPVDVEKSRIALGDAREVLAKATLALRQSEVDLEQTNLVSPIDGIVLERLVNPGEITHRGQILLKIGSLETVLMAAKVTEEKLHSVEQGLPAETSFPAFPNEAFQGKVLKIDPNIDVVTRTFTTYIEIDNPDLRLKPGLSGFTRIRRGGKNALAIPSIAITNPSGEEAFVFVAGDDGHARLRKVHTGAVVNALTEITSGLAEGENVVTVGQLYLKDNDKIQSPTKSNSRS